MIRTFFRRWWMTRKLHEYIYSRGEIPTPLNLAGMWPDFNSASNLPQRIREGVEQQNFILYLRWKWEGWWTGFNSENKPETRWDKFYYKLPWRTAKREYIEEQWAETIKQCEKLNWIEGLPHGRIKVGHEGENVYVWYYPIIAFFSLHYIKITLTRLLEWGIPILLIYLLAHYLDIKLSLSTQ